MTKYEMAGGVLVYLAGLWTGLRMKWSDFKSNVISPLPPPISRDKLRVPKGPTGAVRPPKLR